MAYDLEEQETLDALKAWWDRWGTFIVALLVAGAVVAIGWRGWQWYHSHQASQAMGYFEALETAAQENSPDSLPRIQAASKTLRDEFPRSGYTARAVLIAANALQENGQLDEAANQLKWLVDHDANSALAPLARLRLAGIYLEQGDNQQALALLEQPPAAFVGLFADRRGDILVAQGKPDEARKAWETAVQELADNPVGQIVQLKLDALGGA